MRVFLSWSGEVSHKVACVLKEWLPSVIQSIRPYVSSQDIDKGARWSTDIAKELHESTFGILCVTRENLEAPWINFEAGALSKTIDKASVAPFLFDIKRSEVQGPLLQFQSTINERDDVYKLIVSLNNAMPDGEKLEEAPLRKSFEVWWPELEKALSAIPTTSEKAKPPTTDKPGKLAHSEAILEELLDLTRSQQRLLRSPEELFPKDYVEYVLRHSRKDTSRVEEGLSLLSSARGDLKLYMRRIKTLGDADADLTRTETEQMCDALETTMRRIEYVLRDRIPLSNRLIKVAAGEPRLRREPSGEDKA